MSTARAAFFGMQGEERQRREGLADAQRQNLIQQYTTLRDQAQQVLTSGQAFDKATGSMRPLTDQEKQQLTETTTHLTNYIQRLFNPDVDVTSGQLQEDPLHKLATKLRLAKPPQGAPAGETAPEIAKTAAGFQTQFGETPEAAGAQQRQERERNIKQFEDLAKQYNLPEQVKTDILSRMLGAPGAVTRAKWDTMTGTVDGKRVTWMKNQASGEVTDLAGNEVPADLVTRFVQDRTGAQAKPREAWGKTKDGKYVSFLIDPFSNQEIPGTRNFNKIPPSNIVGRLTTGFYHYVDQLTGEVHQIRETKTSSPAGGPAQFEEMGAEGAPAAPAAAPGPLPKRGEGRATPSGAARPGADRVLGFRGTKDEVQTNVDYNSAIDRDDVMHRNLVDIREAAKRGETDQQAMLSLLFNHIGMTSGAQKGTRITQTMIDEAQSSAPAAARILARLGIDSELDEGEFKRVGALMGVVLTGKEAEQMVHLADEKLQVLKRHVDRLKEEREKRAGGGGQDLRPPSAPAAGMKWQHRTVKGKVEWRQVPANQ